MTPRQVGLLAALAAIWGGSYLLIKYALEDLSAPMIVWARVAVAAVVLFALIRATMGAGRRARPSRTSCATGRARRCCSARWPWRCRSR